MFPTIDQAISQFEGFGTPAAATITAANNPGAIQAGPFASSQGAIGSSGGFAVFPDVATGTAAEDQLVSNYAQRGYTISDLINAWSPATAPGNTPESTQNYINYVAQQAGVSPNTPVSQTAVSTTAQKNDINRGLYEVCGLNPFCWIAGGVAKTFTPSGPKDQTASWSVGRIVAIVLGIIFITVGLLSFKNGTTVTIQNARSTLKA